MAPHPPKLATVAYHEAGHAVACFYLGRRVDRVTIVPRDGSLGHVSGRALPRSVERSGELDTRRERQAAEDAIIATLAGPIAEARFKGRRNHVGASSDDHQAVNLAFRLWSAPAVATAYLDFLGARAQELIDVLWYLVDSLAAELLERRTLSGVETHRTLRRAIREHGELSSFPVSDLNAEGWRQVAWAIGVDANGGGQEAGSRG